MEKFLIICLVLTCFVECVDKQKNLFIIDAHRSMNGNVINLLEVSKELMNEKTFEQSLIINYLTVGM